ncbi:MAG TPA: DUF6152 family protein [Bryobacteraceae bacterium]|nr:DUF6152 family protein [Bryobacteraceae bacterium]
MAALAVALMTGAGPAMAHHSAAAEYEGKTTVIAGTVTRFEWINPHVWIYLDVKDSRGESIHMKCEGNAPSGLIENGWSRDSLKPGDRITIEGYRAKGRPDGFKARVVTLPDGRRLVMGLPLDGALADGSRRGR